MALFLIVRAVPSPQADKANSLTSSEFSTADESNLRFGVAELFQVTVLSSVFALLIAVPIAIGIATFLTNYAPRRAAKPFAVLVDLLAAVPSIVFGLWAFSCWRPDWNRSPDSSTTTSAGSFCSPMATSRWPAAGPSSPRESSWR